MVVQQNRGRQPAAEAATAMIRATAIFTQPAPGLFPFAYFLLIIVCSVIWRFPSFSSKLPGLFRLLIMYLGKPFCEKIFRKIIGLTISVFFLLLQEISNLEILSYVGNIYFHPTVPHFLYQDFIWPSR